MSGRNTSIKMKSAFRLAILEAEKGEALGEYCITERSDVNENINSNNIINSIQRPITTTNKNTKNITFTNSEVKIRKTQNKDKSFISNLIGKIFGNESEDEATTAAEDNSSPIKNKNIRSKHNLSAVCLNNTIETSSTNRLTVQGVAKQPSLKQELTAGRTTAFGKPAGFSNFVNNVIQNKNVNNSDYINRNINLTNNSIDHLNTNALNKTEEVLYVPCTNCNNIIHLDNIGN